MWTAFVICLVVWFLRGRLCRGVYRLAKTEGPEEEKFHPAVGCLAAIPTVLGLLGAATIGVWKLVAWINS